MNYELLQYIKTILEEKMNVIYMKMCYIQNKIMKETLFQMHLVLYKKIKVD